MCIQQFMFVNVFIRHIAFNLSVFLKLHQYITRKQALQKKEKLITKKNESACSLIGNITEYTNFITDRAVN